jgi:hypothetical protein
MIARMLRAGDRGPSHGVISSSLATTTESHHPAITQPLFEPDTEEQPQAASRRRPPERT